MPDEPDNLVLIQLREIRAKLEKLEGIEKRLDTIKADSDQWKGYITPGRLGESVGDIGGDC